MTSELPVALIGEGERFDALRALLQQNGHAVSNWRLPGQPKRAPSGTKRVELAGLRDTPLLFLATPLSGLRLVARQIGDVLTPRHCVIHACQNLEVDTLRTASQLLVEELPTRRFGFVTGPMLAADVRNEFPASGVCASPFPEVWELAEGALVNERFRLYRSNDLVGAEHAAAYARVIAMASGVADAMNLGGSVRATLFARGLAEVARWVTHCGGASDTSFGIAGAANLYLDTSNPGSTDYRVGAFAMRHNAFDVTMVEKEFGAAGLDLLTLIHVLWQGVEHTKIQCHILRACYMMVSGQLNPQGAVIQLMTLPTLVE